MSAWARSIPSAADVGIFNAQVDDIGILGDRPDQLSRSTGGPIGDLPLCSRTLGTDGAGLSLGRPQRPLHPRQRRLDTEDLNGDNLLNAPGRERERLPLRRGPPPGTSTTCGTACSPARPTGPHSGWQLYRIPIRDAEPTPSARPISGWCSTSGSRSRRRRTTGDPDIVARLPWPACGSWARPGSAAPTHRSLGLTGGRRAQRRGVASVISTENSTDLGYTSPPGVVDQVQTKGGDQSSPGHPDQRAVSLRIARARICGQGSAREAYLRLPAGPQNVLRYRTLGCG